MYIKHFYKVWFHFSVSFFVCSYLKHQITVWNFTKSIKSFLLFLHIKGAFCILFNELEWLVISYLGVYSYTVFSRANNIIQDWKILKTSTHQLTKCIVNLIINIIIIIGRIPIFYSSCSMSYHGEWMSGFFQLFSFISGWWTSYWEGSA